VCLKVDIVFLVHVTLRELETELLNIYISDDSVKFTFVL